MSVSNFLQNRRAKNTIIFPSDTRIYGVVSCRFRIVQCQLGLGFCTSFKGKSNRFVDSRSEVSMDAFCVINK